ncbi:MAG TPA: helix-turn-helix domain-containing protein [Thermoanaerobaculia bacterium]|jgi:AcrR family transcriptional regulator
MFRKRQKSDPRVERTRDALGDALLGLMSERPFEAITVQDVLDRAGVGRSTFYAHYRDKEDLLISDVDAFWSLISSKVLRTREASSRVAPVRELFEHVAGAAEVLRAFETSGRTHDVYDLGRLHFARAIEQRLGMLDRARHLDASRRTALAHAFAGALLSTLTWWLGQSERLAPQQMDELYHAMVWTGVGTR